MKECSFHFFSNSHKHPSIMVMFFNGIVRRTRKTKQRRQIKNFLLKKIKQISYIYKNTKKLKQLNRRKRSIQRDHLDPKRINNFQSFWNLQLISPDFWSNLNHSCYNPWLNEKFWKNSSIRNEEWLFLVKGFESHLQVFKHHLGKVDLQIWVEKKQKSFFINI